MEKFDIHDAIYKTNGGNDECYTPEWVVRAILPYIPKGMTVWCPFDTDESFFVRVLRESGFKVVNSHISTGQDFFEYEPGEWDIIVSNPPFTNKKHFFERAFGFGKPFMLLMTAQWLNDSTPTRLYSKYKKDLQLLHFNRRVEFIHTTGPAKKIPFKSLFFCCDVLDKGNIIIEE